MYETLHYIGEVLLQGLLTCLLMFLLTRWYERKTALQKAKVAALFIVLEILEHITVLAEITANQQFPKPDDDDICFPTNSWMEFKTDIVPLLNYKDLRELAIYYRSINIILTMIRRAEPYNEHQDIVSTNLDAAKYFCDFLRNLADYPKSQRMPLEEILVAISEQDSCRQNQ